jgi:hypothetical protein
MDTETTITLYCVRKDGRRERTKISDHTMADARELAEWLLYTGNGLYTEVDICTEDGTFETIRSPGVPSPVGTAWVASRIYLFGLKHDGFHALANVDRDGTDRAARSLELVARLEGVGAGLERVA